MDDAFDAHIRAEAHIRANKPMARSRPCLFRGNTIQTLQLVCTDKDRISEKKHRAASDGYAYVIHTVPSMLVRPPPSARPERQPATARPAPSPWTSRANEEPEDDEGFDIQDSEGDDEEEEEPDEDDLAFIDDGPEDEEPEDVSRRVTEAVQKHVVPPRKRARRVNRVIDSDSE